MKHIFTVLICCIMTMTLHSQTTLNEIYREFSHESNVSKVNLNGVVMFFAKPFMEKQTDSKISSIRVMSLEDCSDAVKQRFNHSLLQFDDNHYELFLSSNEDDEKVRLFLKFKNNKIREMVVMTMGENPALVHLKGRINLSDIEDLRDGRK
jgi:translation elongation factor EF-G